MTKFSGFDLVIKDAISMQALRCALAHAFRVLESRIRMVDDISDYPEKKEADVVGVRSEVEGDFTYLISIHTEPRTLPYSSEHELAQAISAEIGSDCLLPDNSENPYAMYYIPVAGSVSRVFLDDQHEEEGRYVLTRSPTK